MKTDKEKGKLQMAVEEPENYTQYLSVGLP